jgi:drug/metabolite transporter (DMT)-like permease
VTEPQQTGLPNAPAAVPLLAYASLGGSMALVGSYVGLSKLLVAVFPVLLLAWLRFAIAGVAMLPWLKRQPGEPPLSAANKKLLFWESFLGNFLFSICMLYGVSMTSALAAGVTMAAIPAAVAVLSRVFLGERITPRVAGAIVCAVLGIAALALVRSGVLAGPEAGSGTAASATHLLGYALLVAAVLCEASYVVIGKRLTGQVSPQRISALINVWGLVLVTPLGLWQALQFNFAGVQPASWLLLFCYAIAASVVTVWLWMRGLKQVPSAQAGVFTVWLPISAAAVGVGLLGEPFGPAHLVALALALLGLLLATWPARGVPKL